MSTSLRAISAALVLVAVACSGSPSGETTTTRGRDSSTDGAPTDGAEVCNDPGYAWGPCVDGACVDGSACRTTAAGQFCSPPCELVGGLVYVCSQCVDGVKTPACYDKHCAASCTSSQDCGVGMHCDAAAGVCVWPAPAS